ncbi:hypothetical protein B1F79_04815 [Coxiella-like endosymbiont of Rhipicephalus sanguineus]|nr:hypothetical protein [Coxiella-like endosymbiont of Rhipicephalus sanguineus]
MDFFIFKMPVFGVEKGMLGNPDKPILISPASPEITLKLKLNPTIGYSWFLVLNYDHQLFSPVGHRYVPAQGKWIGCFRI